jgi:hypothetical protein
MADFCPSDLRMDDERSANERASADHLLTIRDELEEWRPATGFEGRYHVSSLGRVRSLYFKPPRLVSTQLDKDGYPLIWLWRGQKRRAMNLHRLVAETFHADKRNALHNEVAHLDNDRANSRADNLKWVSKAENAFHRREHGTHGAGELHPRAKLSWPQVLEIRLRPGKASEIALRYGVSRHTIYDIWQGRRWRKGDAPDLSTYSGGMK